MKAIILARGSGTRLWHIGKGIYYWNAEYVGENDIVRVEDFYGRTKA
jgi:choline kinase